MSGWLAPCVQPQGEVWLVHAKIVDSTGAVLFQQPPPGTAATPVDTLPAGQFLLQDTRLYSQNGQYYLVAQSESPAVALTPATHSGASGSCTPVYCSACPTARRSPSPETRDWGAQLLSCRPLGCMRSRAAGAQPSIASVPPAVEGSAASRTTLPGLRQRLSRLSGLRMRRRRQRGAVQRTPQRDRRHRVCHQHRGQIHAALHPDSVSGTPCPPALGRTPASLPALPMPSCLPAFVNTIRRGAWAAQTLDRQCAPLTAV